MNVNIADSTVDFLGRQPLLQLWYLTETIALGIVISFLL